MHQCRDGHSRDCCCFHCFSSFLCCFRCHCRCRCDVRTDWLAGWNCLTGRWSSAAAPLWALCGVVSQHSGPVRGQTSNWRSVVLHNWRMARRGGGQQRHPFLSDHCAVLFPLAVWSPPAVRLDWPATVWTAEGTKVAANWEGERERETRSQRSSHTQQQQLTDTRNRTRNTIVTRTDNYQTPTVVAPPLINPPPLAAPFLCVPLPVASDPAPSHLRCSWARVYRRHHNARISAVEIGE